MSTSSAEPLSNLVAIIPARSGSKRLPDKNLLPLRGKPMIQWTIDAALASGVFSRIVVTSNDSQALDIALQNNLQCIERPEELAGDEASSTDLVRHALQELHGAGMGAEHFMLLQPTSPLRSALDICNAIEVMQRYSCDSVVSVCPCEHPPQWSAPLPDDQSLEHFQQLQGQRSQDFGQQVRLNGAVYLARSRCFIEENRFFCGSCHALLMPAERSVDIDTRTDFLLAEALLTDLDAGPTTRVPGNTLT